MQTNNVYQFNADERYIHDKKQEQAFIMFWRARSVNYKEIGDAVGMTSKTIQRWAKKFDWAARRSELRSRFDAKILTDVGDPVDDLKRDIRHFREMKESIRAQLRQRDGVLQPQHQGVLSQAYALNAKSLIWAYDRLGIDPATRTTDEA